MGNHCSWEAAAQSWGMVGVRVVGEGSEDAWSQENKVTQASAFKAFKRRFCLNSDLSVQLVWHLFLSGFEESEMMWDKGHMPPAD